MKLKELCRHADLVCPDGVGDTEIALVTDHTEKVIPGSLFVAIKGFHTDASGLIPKALAKGAVAILAEKDARVDDPSAILLQTDNARRAFPFLCHAFYGLPSEKMKLIGVTGTNGKTSTSGMLRRILESAMYRCGLIGTVGCDSAGRSLENHNANHLANMTTPDPQDLYRMLREMADDGVEYVIMEVTSHALALEKLAPLHFAAGIFTNLTPEHLDFHKTMQSYADCKAKLFEKCDLSVFNADSGYAAFMAKHAAGRSVFCGTCRPVDYCADGVSFRGNRGLEYDLSSGRTRLHIQCPIPGSFTLMNSMEAAVCALELGISPGVVKDALAGLSGVKGRMERVRLGTGAKFTVLIDYAHTPDALENLLRTVRQMKGAGGRLLLLFGCGGDRDRTKRPVMGKIASDLADVIYLTADNSRSESTKEILSEIRAGIDENTPLYESPDRKEAIERAVLDAGEGDYLVLAGKGHEEYEIIGNERIPFSERQIVKEAYTKRCNQNQEDSTGKKR
ncbi:MAG: UDP-N-acetylmuramoyl-L-alanyl-D-glutamate--2,6-diaminopimelate ligase [Clostridia bacterium]|nr:UDP-N-acetylmuramoyl-L-alanyl-D-glutamate--2,6-diaminopimelate ligase [Clostridia bacterium]